MKHLSTLLMNNSTLCWLLILGVGILFLVTRDWNVIRRKARKSKPISYQDFLENWDEYRSNDTCGCYIILIYRRRPLRRSVRRLKRFNDVYIGQSVNVYKRVYNHVTGHGNGDVYADIKYRKYVYIKFIPCQNNQMNEYEKKLIALLDATSSYNRTKGGAKIIVH